MVQYFAVMPDMDISPLLPRITAPTLVLTGDSDPIVPPAQSHRIAEKVPHADLVVLKGAGHFPSVESPAEYQQVVSEWLRRQLN
jgi:pimeloyl-ACP methyl ester carboxylesterase